MSKSNAMTKLESEARAVSQTQVLTPRYFREMVREQFAQSDLKRLHDMGHGLTRHMQAVAVPGMKDHPPHVEMVEVEAPAMVQAIALKALVDVAIPKQMGLVDSDDKGTGVLVLPALDREEPAEDADYEVISEEIGPDNEAQIEDRDRAPAPLEETISPALVRHVLQRRKNGKAHPKKRTRRHG